MVHRILEKTLKLKLFKKKAIILLGPRQVGKTTLLNSLFANKEDILWMNGDEIDIQNLFSTISADRFRAIIGQKKIIIIDEAQRINNIGLRLKLITDSIPEVQLIATGSSAFELANSVNEPLTGLSDFFCRNGQTSRFIRRTTTFATSINLWILS